MYKKDRSKVIAIIRSTTFGKTLNMSMIRYYFYIKCKNSKGLFKDLKIMKQDEYYTSKYRRYDIILEPK